MENSKIKQLAEALKKRETLRFNVLDATAFKKTFLDTQVDQKKLDQDHQGSLVNYIDYIIAKGYEKITLEPRLRNGTGDSPAPYGSISISVKNSTPENTLKKTDTSAPPPPKSITGQSLNIDAVSVMKGLSAVERLEELKTQYSKLENDHNVACRDRDNFKESKKDLERDIKDLGREKKEVEEKLQKLTKKYQKKKEKLEETSTGLNGAFTPEGLQGIKEIVAIATPLITPLLAKRTGNAAQENTTAVESNENLEETRKVLIEVAKEWPKNMVDLLHALIMKLSDSENGQQIFEQLQQLLSVQPLRKVENDG